MGIQFIVALVGLMASLTLQANAETVKKYSPWSCYASCNRDAAKDLFKADGCVDKCPSERNFHFELVNSLFCKNPPNKQEQNLINSAQKQYQRESGASQNIDLNDLCNRARKNVGMQEQVAVQKSIEAFDYKPTLCKTGCGVKEARDLYTSEGCVKHCPNEKNFHQTLVTYCTPIENNVDAENQRQKWLKDATQKFQQEQGRTIDTDLLCRAAIGNLSVIKINDMTKAFSGATQAHPQPETPLPPQAPQKKTLTPEKQAPGGDKSIPPIPAPEPIATAPEAPTTPDEEAEDEEENATAPGGPNQASQTPAPTAPPIAPPPPIAAPTTVTAAPPSIPAPTTVAPPPPPPSNQPPQAQPNSPSGQGDLLAEIRKGKELKKTPQPIAQQNIPSVATTTAAPPPPPPSNQPSQAQPKPPSGQGDLLAEIRKGKELKKTPQPIAQQNIPSVAPTTVAPPPPPSSNQPSQAQPKTSSERGGLLEQIRQGAKLKHVDNTPPPSQTNPNPQVQAQNQGQPTHSSTTNNRVRKTPPPLPNADPNPQVQAQNQGQPANLLDEIKARKGKPVQNPKNVILPPQSQTSSTQTVPTSEKSLFATLQSAMSNRFAAMNDGKKPGDDGKEPGDDEDSDDWDD